MAETFDGSINIDTRLKTIGFNNGMKEVEKTAAKSINNIAKSTSSGFGNVLSTIGKFIRNIAIGIVGMTVALFSFGDQLITKLEKSLDVQSAYYQQLQLLRTEFYRVQAAVFSIFSTLLQAALPAIIRIVDWLVRMLDIINQVVAALLGQSSVQKVVASSVADTADAAGKAAKHTKKMKDEAKGALAAFDKIDVLQKKNEKDNEDANGGANAGGLKFETVPIEQKWQDLANKIKIIWNDIIQGVLTAWQTFVNAWNNFWSSPFGQLLIALFNNWVDTWKKIFDNTIETINNIKAGIERAFKGIGEVIRGLITGDWRLVFQGLKDIVGGTFDAISAFIIGNLKNWSIYLQGLGNQFSLTFAFIKSIVDKVLLAIIIIWIGAIRTIQNAWADLANWFQRIVIAPLQNYFNVAITWISNKFNSAFSGIGNIARGAFNGLIDVINGILRRVADAINNMGNMINPLSQIFGWSIPRVSAPSIPRLATGAVIPPNSQFLAVMGDQKSGRNIEAPEGLIRKIIREELTNIGGQKVTINFAGNLAALVREMKPYIDNEDKRSGVSLAGGLK